LKAGVEFEFIGDEPPGSLLYGLLRAESPAHQRIAVARKAVSRNVCHEIPPRLRISRSAADYVGMEMPDLGLLINGGAPPKSVNKWMKYQITLMPNHPWQIVLFSTQDFQLTGAGNESLFVLSHPEYNLLAGLTRSQPCSPTLPHDYKGGGRISEYHNGRTRVCWLSRLAACDYLTTISTLPDIHWTAEQAKSIHGLSWDTECKDSGWWEFHEKFRQDTEAWAKSHPDESNPTILPEPKQSPASDR
jgi:hypothetical protein